MSITMIEGNIFTSKAQVLVNAVNCKGIMGAGIALEFRLRYPEMFERYVEICTQNLLYPGKLWLFKSENLWVLNFPTKDDWRSPTTEAYLKSGLQKFTETYQDKGIKHIAFPLLGASHGGLDAKTSEDIMLSYLSQLENITLEIYKYKSTAPDELFHKLRAYILKSNAKELSKDSGLSSKQSKQVIEAVQSNEIFQINQLLKIKGLGVRSIEKLFALCINNNETTQPSLF